MAIKLKVNRTQMIAAAKQALKDYPDEEVRIYEKENLHNGKIIRVKDGKVLMIR